MPTRQDLLEAARSFKGLKYIEAGAHPEAGCNCLGLWVLVARKIGLDELAAAAEPFAQHKRERAVGDMLKLLTQHLKPIPLAKARPGDLLLFPSNDKSLQHLGMVSDRKGYVIEASDQWGKVDEFMKPLRSARRAFEIPGLDD